jgi:hypothetical protein
MEENNFITVHQHGFRKGRLCATQLIEVVKKWTEELDNNNSIYLVLAIFQILGNFFSSMDLLNILVAGLEILTTVSLINLGCIESDP